jgi:hypothetical protein
LDEETRKALLFQFKIEIEEYYNIYLSTKEWEIKRYQNISNYSSVTIPGFCNICKSEVPFQYDLLSYLNSIYEMKKPYPSGIITTDCINCGKEHSLSGRVMLSTWDALLRG